MSQLLQSLCDEFTKRCGGTAIIAGGSVRDTLLGREPKDYDVFVLRGKFRDGWGNGLEVVDSPEWHKSEPNLQRTFRIDGRIVQVMKSDWSLPGQVLDHFDWNVSQFAFNGDFLQLTDLTDIGEGKELRLHRVTYPVSTLRRGFRFSERFGMQFRKEDLRDLCALAASRLVECQVGAQPPAEPNDER